MAQMHTSPNTKLQTKPSLKKSNKADQSKSKKNLIDDKEVKDISGMKSQQKVEEKIDPKLMSKSSKKAALELKGQAQFKQQVIEAGKSEKSAKIMKSTDRNTALKENHNNIESNRRQFSLSKQEDEHLEVSKKKINTESKKSKIVQDQSKHSKTEEKAVNSELKEEKPALLNIAPEKPHQPEQLKSQLASSVIQQAKTQNSQNLKNNNTKVENIKQSQTVNDTKMSKNFKRSEVSKSQKEGDQSVRNFNKSKSSKASIPRPQTRSKDSKGLEKRNGDKKAKPNERWH